MSNNYRSYYRLILAPCASTRTYEYPTCSLASSLVEPRRFPLFHCTVCLFTDSPYYMTVSPYFRLIYRSHCSAGAAPARGHIIWPIQVPLSHFFLQPYVLCFPLFRSYASLHLLGVSVVLSLFCCQNISKSDSRAICEEEWVIPTQNLCKVKQKMVRIISMY
jgi:hypothetical protein